MSAAVDYYDVQRMVEDEARSRRAAIDELRELLELRNREALEALGEEVAALQRVIDARTGHLA